MYSKTKVNVNYFNNSNKANTEKCVFGRVSERVNTGRTDEQGKAIYEYENWDARFVGKAKDKAAALADKTAITLTEWNCHSNYDKEKKQSFPYLMVMDFELRERDPNNLDAEGAVISDDFIEIEEFEDLPY